MSGVLVLPAEEDSLTSSLDTEDKYVHERVVIHDIRFHAIDSGS